MLFLKLMKEGGPIMWVILVLDIIALATVLQKTFQFHREEINVRELLHGLFNVLKREGFIEAVSLCDNTPGPVARMLSAAIAANTRINIGKVFFTTANAESVAAAAPVRFAFADMMSVHASATKMSIVVRTSFTFRAPWNSGSPIIA